ncbi:Glutaredoxin/DEP/DUF547 domain-containing protein [Quillaja saponaria]|uniref:Glutaredoxin/DEP/DUF547 domain-containing protein n=1 Tax=Quillaja saponaria TaxID=32244 RepID=A0AAD7LWX8_QUISA|nr:Glutaredoxin/DEP/DUF547 domain-containing protein [Quillaja saponaria]
MEKEELLETYVANSRTAEKLKVNVAAFQDDDQGKLSKEDKALDIGNDNPKLDKGGDDLGEKTDESRDLLSLAPQGNFDKTNVQVDLGHKVDNELVTSIGLERASDKVYEKEDLESKAQDEVLNSDGRRNSLGEIMDESRNLESTQENQKTEEILGEDNNLEPVFDGTEVPGMEVNRSTSSHSLDIDQETQGVVEKAVALKNYVREKSFVAVSSVLRRLSGKSDEVSDDEVKDVLDSPKDSESKEVSHKTVERSAWNPLNFIKMPSDADQEKKAVERELITDGPVQPICSFNEIIIGGLSDLKALNESGKLDEKIDYLITEAPPFEAPLPPLSGEDDVSSSGSLDELALIVRKMKTSIVVKDRFYKMRWFTNCFLGSEALDFLSEDQYLEREEAIEFGRKLASKLFFNHVLDENLLEDGNHLYRFLDDDPIVASQCQNIPNGIITVKPKPISDIASRLRFLFYAILEAYTSEDGRHVDYRSIHGSEEFARYLRIVEELQRVELQHMSREQKLAFFINLYNMMSIHALLVLGHPAGALERRKLFGDFKYVIGGSSYSLSAIHNGILRGNQRPPYNLLKPLGAKDKRLQVALPYPEPLIHFALVWGTRSGPALRCYSPGNIDKELMEAVRYFLSSGGLIIDLNAKVASASMILKWFSVDFGKNEVEVLKHVSNYLDPADSAPLLELLANSQLKVIYQPYDWGLNY